MLARIPDATRLALFYAWKNDGLTTLQLAARFKVNKSTAWRILNEERKKKHRIITTTALATRPVLALPPAVPATELKGNGRPRKGSKYTHLYPQIVRLRQQGFTTRLVADKLNMSPSAVSYYFMKMKKQAKLIPRPEGASSDGQQQQLSKEFLIGYASAELDRTIDGISSRIGIPPNVLRGGFSKFLASTSFRK